MQTNAAALEAALLMASAAPRANAQAGSILGNLNGRQIYDFFTSN